MKPLPTSYKKNSYQFNQLFRDENTAIYEQKDTDTGRLVAYEVFEIIKNQQRVMAGKLIEATESTPSNEDWGTKGFTCHTYSQAEKRRNEIKARIEARKQKQVA